MENVDATEAALEAVFGANPAPVANPAEQPVTLTPEQESDALQQTADEATQTAEPQPEPVQPEPEFTVEVDGKTELVAGNERVRELLQKGLHYSRGSEENARLREQLAAQAQVMQNASNFQREIIGDITELRAMDKQLEQFSQVEWSKVIDTDFTQALKLQEQRNALKEARAAKLAEINGKHQQFDRSQEAATRQLLASEEATLVAKLPEWRNSDKAMAEKQAIVRNMAHYGFQQAEIATLTDHRMVLMARDAMQWRELQRNKVDKVKRAVEAPPVIKPGAAATQQDPNSKAGFAKFTQDFRKAGRSGNHRAQEAALERVLSRTFK